MNLRDFLGIWTRLKESIVKNNNQLNSIVTTRRWVLSTEWTRTRLGTGLVYEWKNDSVPIPNPHSLVVVSMLFFRMCGCCIVLTKMKAMSVVSLSFSKRCYQYSFSEILKGTQVSSSHVGNGNVPSNDYYDDTNNYLVPSEKPSNWKVFKKNSQRRWTIFPQLF